MDALLIILLAIAALAGAYFVFVKRSAAPQLKPPPTERPLPGERPGARPAARAKAAAEKAAPSAAAATEVAVEIPAPIVEARPSLTQVSNVEGLRQGLAKSRSEAGIFGRLRAIFGGKKELNPDIAEQIEEVLLSSDVGVQTSQTILGRVKETLTRGDLVDSGRVWEALREEARRILSVHGDSGAFQLRAHPTVVILVGVNGAGKTTTIGKLATKLQSAGHKCVLAAADTFRAAAVQQLVVWGQRVGCEVVRGKEGADPGSVVFDAIKRAQELDADVVLADTAGRLHTKTNLMAEMKKVIKTADKAMPGAPHEVLLVIDATNGQNALAQAREFQEALPLTGVVLTKLDGTAKGGIILGICDSLALPVRFVGLGERADDLHPFSPDEFVEALLGRDTEASAA